jgi:hypothetical protein
MFASAIGCLSGSRICYRLGGRASTIRIRRQLEHKSSAARHRPLISGVMRVTIFGMAMDAYFEAISPDNPLDRKSEINLQLRANCQFNTFAVVRL